MSSSTQSTTTATTTAVGVLLALSLSHMLNDMLQSLIPAMYPLIKESLRLDFTQIGLITLTFQMSSSILQPLLGLYTDKHPQPYALPVGMGFTMAGILLLSIAGSFWMVLLAVMLTGVGSSVFHPEASRLAHMASGGRLGFAQSIFQVGGTLGSSMGPLLAALIITPFGQQYAAWFCLAALLAMLVMLRISRWYKANLHLIKARAQATINKRVSPYTRRQIVVSLGILLVLIFSKYFYVASLTSYYTFYLMSKFGISTSHSQLLLFVFLFSSAAGTLLGGPLGDRIGRKYVIWISILGVAPFTLLMPHMGLAATVALSVIIGFVLSSAFSAILVYAQELLPGKVGTIAGLFFGLAFGMAGIASAVLGKLADATSIEYVYQVCAYLPLLGVVAVFLPNHKKRDTVES